MANTDRQTQTAARTPGRREEDFQIRDQIRQHRQIFHVGQIITSEMNLENLFDVIMDQTVRIMGAQRCSLFLHDAKTDQLWSLVATDLEKNEIRIPVKTGVAGWVFRHRQSLLIEDAYADPRFYAEIDRKTGFRTRSIICIPLVNRQGRCIGTLQALNKRSGCFTKDDRELLTSISYYVAVALENSKLYEDLKSMNAAKKKVIDHLAHELKTPLAIIDGAMKFIFDKVADPADRKLEKAVNRCRRNLKRLLNLQEKIDDILGDRPVKDHHQMLNLITDAVCFVGKASPDRSLPPETFAREVSRRLKSFYETDPYVQETIRLDQLLPEICRQAKAGMAGRELAIRCRCEDRCTVAMDRRVVGKVFGGLLQNAIEATPDEGKIEISAATGPDTVTVSVKDWGVGITPENQKNIFGGFFHTQDTDFYSSRAPYAFYAGGSGSDLLRIKVFSERYGFSIDFQSTCCRYIPGVKNMCPGRISRCRHITDPAGCFASGGSTFTVRFPLQRKPGRSSLDSASRF